MMSVLSGNFGKTWTAWLERYLVVRSSSQEGTLMAISVQQVQVLRWFMEVSVMLVGTRRERRS